MLKDALVQLWEQTRAKRVAMIGTLKVRMFDAGDAFRVLGTVGAVSGAKKVVAITGGYETPDGGTFELEFRGPVPDAEPVKEFLEQQLRGAKSATVEATFDLSFAEGLPMEGDPAETLTDRLCRFASGAAHVSAAERLCWPGWSMSSRMPMNSKIVETRCRPSTSSQTPLSVSKTNIGGMGMPISTDSMKLDFFATLQRWSL